MGLGGIPFPQLQCSSPVPSGHVLPPCRIRFCSLREISVSGILSGSWTSTQSAPWVFSRFSCESQVGFLEEKPAKWWEPHSPRASQSQASPHSVSSNSLNIPVWFSYPLLWRLVASVPGKQVLRSHVSQRVSLSRFWNSFLLCKFSSLFNFQSVQISFCCGKHWKDNLTALHLWAETGSPNHPCLGELTYKNVNFIWFDLIDYDIVSG